MCVWCVCACMCVCTSQTRADNAYQNRHSVTPSSYASSICRGLTNCARDSRDARCIGTAGNRFHTVACVATSASAELTCITAAEEAVPAPKCSSHTSTDATVCGSSSELARVASRRSVPAGNCVSSKCTGMPICNKDLQYQYTHIKFFHLKSFLFSIFIVFTMQQRWSLVGLITSYLSLSKPL